MRLILTIFLSILYLAVSAQKQHSKQDIYSNYLNSSQNAYIFIGPGLEYKGTLSIDGKEYKGVFSSINEKDIYVVDSIANDTSHEFGTSADDMIIVITKKATADLYKEIFSKRSPDYKRYLVQHNDSDAELTYSIVNNNSLISNTDNNKLNALYSLCGKDFKSISLKTLRVKGQIKTLVTIETKP